jgi:SAM-dependent methyltransferase
VRKTILVCPRCRGSLDEETWLCLGCGATFRALRGIPDLRVTEDGFLSNQEDWEFARRLEVDFDRLDFRRLLGRYFDISPDIPTDLRKRQVEHIITARGRSQQWRDLLGTSVTGGPLLDLGCGTGSFLANSAANARQSWGVDIAMRWLLLARKRLDEEGLGHIRVVCGCAEALPFADESFSGVVGGDVFEHVADQSATLAEAHRVLQRGGRVVFASPNRFSLAPEPHVQVWGVGYLPRRWMSPYVRWRREIDFRAIRTLGLGEWRRLLRSSPFGHGEVRAPGLPESDLSTFGPLKRMIARCYNSVVASPVGQALATRIGPLFHVACTKESSERRPTNRAIRPHSTSRAERAPTESSQGASPNVGLS